MSATGKVYEGGDTFTIEERPGVFTHSSRVAEVIGRKHASIRLTIIRCLRRAERPDRLEGDFIPFGYVDRQGKRREEGFAISDNGLALLLCSFTGEKAARIKELIARRSNRASEACGAGDLIAPPVPVGLPDFTDPVKAAIAWAGLYSAYRDKCASAAQQVKLLEAKRSDPPSIALTKVTDIYEGLQHLRAAASLDATVLSRWAGNVESVEDAGVLPVHTASELFHDYALLGKKDLWELNFAAWRRAEGRITFADFGRILDYVFVHRKTTDSSSLRLKTFVYDYNLGGRYAVRVSNAAVLAQHQLRVGRLKREAEASGKEFIPRNTLATQPSFKWQMRLNLAGAAWLQEHFWKFRDAWLKGAKIRPPVPDVRMIKLLKGKNDGAT